MQMVRPVNGYVEMHSADDLHMNYYAAFDRLIASGMVPDVVVTVFFNFILGEILPHASPVVPWDQT